MKQVFLQLPTDPNQPLNWLLRDTSHNEVTRGSGPVEALAPLAAGRQVIVLVPGEQVVLTETELQIRQAAKLRKALPYALEDQLSEDVDELHFAFRQGKDGKVQVAVVNEERLRQWLAPLEAEGIALRFATPDTLALPWSENSWSIVIEGDRAVVRTGETEGFVSEREGLEDFLAAVLETREEPPERIHVWYCSDNSEPLHWPDHAPALETHPCNGGLLDVASTSWAPEKSINLLQGAFSADLELAKHLKPWRWAAGLLVIWFGIMSAQQLIEKQRLETKVNAAKEQMVSLYRQTFPEARKVPNPRVQMEQKLKALKGGAGQSDSDFLSLLAASAPAVSADGKTTLEGINFRRGKLTFQLSAKSLGELESLKEKLAQSPKLDAELLAADSSGGKATGQIRISAK